MSADPCDGCGQPVRIAGGMENLWVHDEPTAKGMTLEFPDGTEHFLCFACIDRLPEGPTATDVEALDPEEI
jgi:hypothetical protein